MRGNSTRRLAARLSLLVACLTATVGRAEEARLSLTPLDGKVRVEIDGQLFTEYVYRGYAKPILYPVLGPGQLAMTRHFPVKADVAGEPTDHLHHKSIWFAHGNINGVSFWDERGTIEHARIVSLDRNPTHPAITAENVWKTLEGKVVCTDTTTIGFLALPGEARAIDYAVTFHASQGDVKFGDTKEGMMALRTHPRLQLDPPKESQDKIAGHAVNSEGIKDRAVWGKRAKWVDYHGTVEGRVVGIAIFDDPRNLRHPTHWHARNYGLVAANPFGASAYEGPPPGRGDYVLPSGESLTLRYRLVFHAGDAREARIEDLYAKFSAGN